MIQGVNFLGGNFMNVILASSSPRRREIMSILTDDFICIPPDINEIAPSDIELELKPQYIATQKAKYISKGHRDAMVIGCDTSVIIDGKILNKPVNTEHARRMLRLLSGNTHKVITGCCINYRGLERCFSVSTEVEFFELTENEIESYVNTTEPYDKAGGYGIQSHGALFVKGINGDYYNVVGMPISRIAREASELLMEYEKQAEQKNKR